MLKWLKIFIFLFSFSLSNLSAIAKMDEVPPFGKKVSKKNVDCPPFGTGNK